MVSVQKALIHLIDNKVLCYQAGAQVSEDHFVSQHSLGKNMGLKSRDSNNIRIKMRTLL